MQLTSQYEPYREVEISVDEYESRRPSRRKTEDLRLGWIERRRMLLRSGYSEDDLEAARKSAKAVRRQRERTASTHPLVEVVEAAQQSLFRKLGRTVSPAKAAARDAVPTTKY